MRAKHRRDEPRVPTLRRQSPGAHVAGCAATSTRADGTAAAAAGLAIDHIVERVAAPQSRLASACSCHNSFIAAPQAVLAARAPELRLVQRTTVQVACYPGSPAEPRRYRRHRDAVRVPFGAEEGRKVTALFYLNADWTACWTDDRRHGQLVGLVRTGWLSVPHGVAGGRARRARTGHHRQSRPRVTQASRSEALSMRRAVTAATRCAILAAGRPRRQAAHLPSDEAGQPARTSGGPPA